MANEDPQLKELGLTRRNLLYRGAAGATALSLTGLLAACGSSGSSSGAGGGSAGGGGGSSSLTFVSYGGSLQKAITTAWLDPYMKENPGLKILQDNPTEYPKIELMVKSDAVTWDLVDVGDEYGLGSSEQFLEPIDCNVIECKANKPTAKSRTPYYQFAMTLGYLTSTFPKPPQHWEEFFDVKTFPGKRAMWKVLGQGGVLEIALLGDGVSPDELYPLDIERALAKLDTIKSEIIWYTDLAQATQLLQTKEAAMASIISSRAYAGAVEAGLPIEVSWNEALTANDYFVIPKGSPNAEAAQKLAAFITSAEHNADLSKIYPLSPTNVAAQKKVDPSADTYKWLPSTHQKNLVPINDQYYDEHYEEDNQKFEEWVES
jgi:putative spermidine/putrescine transport system substrate-binding protein